MFKSLIRKFVRATLSDMLRDGALVPTVHGTKPDDPCCGPDRSTGGHPQPVCGCPDVVDQPEPAAAQVNLPQGQIAVPVVEVEARLKVIAAALVGNRVPGDIVTILAIRRLHNNLVNAIAEQAWSQDPAFDKSAKH